MEEEQSIFILSVNAEAKDHLKEAAKWAKLFSVLGMVVVGLMIIGSITTFARLSNSSPHTYSFSLGHYAGVRFIQVISVFITPVISFFPLLFLLRFSNKAKVALAADDQIALSECFQSLKKCFRCLGIVAIVLIALRVLVFVFMGLAYMR